jgi:hypothetical protein
MMASSSRELLALRVVGAVFLLAVVVLFMNDRVPYLSFGSLS